MINKEYRKAALKTYGDSCEICGHRTSLEIHHIDYQEQNAAEVEIRMADRKKSSLVPELLKTARENGWIAWTGGQLSKNDSTLNLSVLCGNCHGLMHCMDVGKKLLKAIKPRRNDR